MRSAVWAAIGLCVALASVAGCRGDSGEPAHGTVGGEGGEHEASQSGSGTATVGGGDTQVSGAGGGAGAGGRPIAPALSGAAGEGGSGAAPEPDSIEGLIADYLGWQALGPAYDVSAEILGLCRSPTANENAFSESEHSGFALRHWANDLALHGIQQGTPFAEGAAIVKEKLGYVPSTIGTEVMALGVMVKRAPGFDGASGDWQFAYYSEADGVLTDIATQKACASCHASSSATDFVFLDAQWRLGEDFP